MIDQIKELLSYHLDLDASNKVKLVFTDGTSVAAGDAVKLVQHMSTIAPFPYEETSFLIDPKNKEIGKVIVEQMKQDEKKARLVRLNSSSPIVLEDVRVYLDCTKKREIEFLVDPKDNRIIEGFTFPAWKTCVGPQLAADRIFGPAMIEYNPTVLTACRVLSEEENRQTQGTMVFNKYYAPDWKLRREKGDTGRLHPLMGKFFENFIPDQACREYVFERMMMIVDKRLPVILVMNTLTGTGKGLFVESILRRGVGRDNWTAAPKSWDKSGFNSWMDSKQIVWFDEEKVMPDGEGANTNYLKRLANDYQAIEKKGQDVNGTTKVYTSIIVTNNQGTKNFRLEEDNRRFSVIDVGLEKMSMIYGEEETEELANAIVENKDGMVDDFWLWLSANYSTENYGNPFTLWKGVAYKMFLYESRSLWQKTVIDACKEGESFKIFRTTLDKNFKDRKHGTDDRTSFPVHISKIESFLKEYTEDNKRLGKLIRPTDKNNREWWIEIDDHWLSPEVKREKELGLEEVKIYPEPTDNTADRIADLEADFDLGDL